VQKWVSPLNQSGTLQRGQSQPLGEAATVPGVEAVALSANGNRRCALSLWVTRVDAASSEGRWGMDKATWVRCSAFEVSPVVSSCASGCCGAAIDMSVDVSSSIATRLALLREAIHTGQHKDNYQQESTEQHKIEVGSN
jgi:hypothetical protein